MAILYSKEDRKMQEWRTGILLSKQEKKNGIAVTILLHVLSVKAKGDWQYGKIEVSARLPKGIGTWPAIWMLGSTTPLKWPDDGEIDIMELVGYNQGFIHASVHCKKYYHVIGTQKTDTIEVKDCSEKFHIYSVEWNKEFSKHCDGWQCIFPFWQ
ncbi:MAG: glycoside hydrolase family 16 protein [Bacteroidota bacterium]